MDLNARRCQDFAHDLLHMLGPRDEAVTVDLDGCEDICLAGVNEEIQRSFHGLYHPSMAYLLGSPLPRRTSIGPALSHDAVLGSLTPNWMLPASEGDEYVDLRLPELELCRPSSPPTVDEDTTTYIDSIGSVVEAQAPPIPEERLESSPEPDWESKKPIIHELYMIRQMPLRKVSGTMKTVYGFKASDRMYKRQFEKWRWSKYYSKRHRTNLAAGLSVEKNSCTRSYGTRRPPRRSVTPRQHATSAPPDPPDPGSVRALVHPNDVSRHLGSALTAVRYFLYGYAENDPRWWDASRFDNMATASWTLYETIFGALLHLDRGEVEVEVGGRQLRRAFGALDKLVTDLDSAHFIQLCCYIPEVCIYYKRADIAGKLFCHVGALARLKLGSQHPLAAACTSLWKLLLCLRCGDGDAGGFGDGLKAVSQMWTATVGDMRRGPGAWSLPDRNALEARRRDLFIRGARDADAAVLALVADYETLLCDAKREFGMHHDAALCLENEILDVQEDLDQPLDVRRHEQLSHKIAEMYATRGGHGVRGIEGWEEHHQNIYVRCQERLCEYFEATGDLERMIEFGRKVICGTVASWRWGDSWCLRLEERLQKAGKEVEASEFKLRRLGSAENRDLERASEPGEQEFLRGISQGTSNVGTIGVGNRN